MTYTIILIITSLLLIPGIIASFIPGIPNLIYMLLVALVFGVYDGFLHITVSDIIILTIISVGAMIVDFFAGIVGAKWGGASWVSIIYGLAGLILGSMFIPVPVVGSVIGMFLGILSYEFYRTKNIRKAHKAAVGSLLGFLAGSGVRVIASIVLFVLFIVFAIS